MSEPQEEPQCRPSQARSENRSPAARPTRLSYCCTASARTAKTSSDSRTRLRRDSHAPPFTRPTRRIPTPRPASAISGFPESPSRRGSTASARRRRSSTPTSPPCLTRGGWTRGAAFSSASRRAAWPRSTPRRGWRRLAGVVGFSGALLDAETLPDEARSKPPFLLAHGGADIVVPPTATAEASQTLDGLGFEVEAHILPGLGHGIDDRGLELAAQFMERVLA